MLLLFLRNLRFVDNYFCVGNAESRMFDPTLVTMSLLFPCAL